MDTKKKIGDWALFDVFFFFFFFVHKRLSRVVFSI